MCYWPNLLPHLAGAQSNSVCAPARIKWQAGQHCSLLGRTIVLWSAWYVLLKSDSETGSIIMDSSAFTAVRRSVVQHLIHYVSMFPVPLQSFSRLHHSFLSPWCVLPVFGNIRVDFDHLAGLWLLAYELSLTTLLKLLNTEVWTSFSSSLSSMTLFSMDYAADILGFAWYNCTVVQICLQSFTYRLHIIAHELNSYKWLSYNFIKRS